MAEASHRAKDDLTDGQVVFSIQVPETQYDKSTGDIPTQNGTNGSSKELRAEDTKDCVCSKQQYLPQQRQSTTHRGRGGGKLQKKQLSWSCEDIRIIEPVYRQEEKTATEDEATQADLSRGQLVKKYQLHVFVALIFLTTVVSVSLAWHYRFLAMKMLQDSQAIFFDPRSRRITLNGKDKSKSISGQIGLDMSRWQLPLHCPLIMNNNPHAKECVWKNNAILRIVHFTSSPGETIDQVEVAGVTDGSVSCYNVSWESLHPDHVPHDCFDIGEDNWFGPSNQTESIWPIRGKFSFNPTNYEIGNNGIFSTVTDFYWLSAKGVALRINANDPIQVFWNQTEDNKLCVLSNYTGPFYHQINRVTAPHLNYTLCTGPDALRTHSFMLTMMSSKDSLLDMPQAETFRGSHWSLKSYLGDDTECNQTQVTEFAKTLSEKGFENNIVVMDNKWQTHHGDLSFDHHRFSNTTEMFEELEAAGSRLSLSVSPYFDFSSRNFRQGATEDVFVLDAGGQVPGLVSSEFGLAAIVDVSIPDGREWLVSRLQNMTKDSQLVGLQEESSRGEGSPKIMSVDPSKSVAGLRLTYGSKGWLPYKPHFHRGEEETPNMFRQHMTEMFAQIATSLVVEHTSDSRHIAGHIPVKTYVSKRNGQHCLTGTIETALTLGIMGYPFIMADGLSGGDSSSIGDISSELFLRWLELATLFPIHQHTVIPWWLKDSVDTVIDMAVNITRDNEALKMKVLNDAQLRVQVSQGLPLLRPLWWYDTPNMTQAMEVTDQFLIGDRFLVAPVLCEGVTSRDVLLPRGVWQDHHVNSRYVIGPVVIENHTAPLGRVIVFKKVVDTDVTGYKEQVL